MCWNCFDEIKFEFIAITVDMCKKTVGMSLRSR